MQRTEKTARLRLKAKVQKNPSKAQSPKSDFCLVSKPRETPTEQEKNQHVFLYFYRSNEANLVYL